MTITDTLSIPAIRFVDILDGSFPGRSNDTNDRYLFALDVFNEKDGGSLNIFHVEKKFVWISKLVVSNKKCCRANDALFLDHVNSLIFVLLTDNKTVLTVDLMSDPPILLSTAKMKDKITKVVQF